MSDRPIRDTNEGKILLVAILLLDSMMLGGLAYATSQPRQPCPQFTQMWNRAFAYVNATLMYPVSPYSYTQLLSVGYSNEAYPFELQHSGTFTITFHFGHSIETDLPGEIIMTGHTDFNRTVTFSWVCKP